MSRNIRRHVTAIFDNVAKVWLLSAIDEQNGPFIYQPNVFMNTMSPLSITLT